MYKTIKDFNFSQDTVVVRVDFNVPRKDNVILDDTRIVKSLPTIQYLIERGCKVVLLSHLGKVKTEEDKMKNSLEGVSKVLGNYLKQDVLFTRDFDHAKELIGDMKPGEVLLLENTRWFDASGKLESQSDEELSKYFASLGTIFINDAFGTIHRKHASNYGISKILPSGIGFLVEEELKGLEVLDHPRKPYVVILGGSKVSDKTLLIENLVQKCDFLLIGGGMAFTFLKAMGFAIGNSIIEDDHLDFCMRILRKYHEKMIFPIDFICNKDLSDVEGTLCNVDQIEDGMMGLDIGPKTVMEFCDILESAKTVMWNGPLGVYELKNYQMGTKKVLEMLADLPDCYKVLGGGDIVAACNTFGLSDKMDHISTGGGATLEYLQGTELPGLVSIDRK